MSRASKRARRVYRRALRNTLDAFTSVGCYPILYAVRGWEPLDGSGLSPMREGYCCAACATIARADGARVSGEVFWEGDAWTCDACDETIASAYGPVDDGGARLDGVDLSDDADEPSDAAGRL